MTMSSVGEYKTVEDVISDLNVMIVEAPIPDHIAMILANVVGELEDDEGTARIADPRYREDRSY